MAEPHGDFDASHPKNDPRPVDELISFLLGGPEEDPYWDAVGVLHWRGTREVLDWAVGLCRSFCAVERRAGADILGQLGVPERTFPEEGLGILLTMLKGEEDPNVLRAILVALSHHRHPEVVAPASRFRHHSDPDVRLAVVFALMGHEDSEALGALVELTRDPVVYVRDWATFALGSQVEAVDTTELREALVERLTDPDDDTRAEALIGLARRGDRRMLPALREELTSGSVGTLALEAAALIGDPGLHPLLVALRDRWDGDEGSLGEAIQACSPRTGLAI
jgi:HEAT repeat protein